jgi:hypothetical protein
MVGARRGCLVVERKSVGVTTQEEKTEVDHWMVVRLDLSHSVVECRRGTKVCRVSMLPARKKVAMNYRLPDFGLNREVVVRSRPP